MAKKSISSPALKAKPAKVKSSPPPSSKKDFDADDMPMKGKSNSGMPSGNMGRSRGRGSLGGDY